MMTTIKTHISIITLKMASILQLKDTIWLNGFRSKIHPSLVYNNVSFKGEHKIHPNQMVPGSKKVLSDKNRIQTKNNKKINISF